MKHLVPYILFLALLCAISLFAGTRVKEAFQSAGTLVQLETSHVPTRAELRDESRWLRQRL